jgi:hypothetical protein
MATDLRRLPPAEPLELTERQLTRFSMTLLRYFNRCARSAYLSLKWGGGPPGHHLNRGSVAHAAFERMMHTMIDAGEPRIPMDMAKLIMAEAIAQSPHVVPAEEQGRLRVMAAHFAEGVVIDPSLVVGVERKLRLRVGDFDVICKLDVVLRDGEVLEIWDWKTAYAMSRSDEIAEVLRDGRMGPKAFQLLVYVLAAAFGEPIRRCEECDGRGEIVFATLPGGMPRRVQPGEVIHVRGEPSSAIYDADECPDCGGSGDVVDGEPLGEGVNLFRALELYPQFLFDDGLGRRGPLDVTRPELIDHQLMLEGLVMKLGAQLGVVPVDGIEPWTFEAVPGSHCPECPARGECPIPEHIRAPWGAINSMEEAEAAAVELEMQRAHDRARQTELRKFAERHGPIRVGADEVMDFSPEERRSVDREGLLSAATEAAEFGVPFDPDLFVKRSTSNRFSKRKLAPDELAEMNGDADLAADDKWGADAPF